MSHGDRSVAGIASGGERVGRLVRDHVDLRHRNADFLREALNGGVGAWEFLARDGLSAVHGERDLVGVEVGDEVHDGGEGQSEEHPVLAAEGTANEHQKQRHRGQKERGLKCVSHNFCGTASLDV